jgi:hypothetical protein
MARTFVPLDLVGRTDRVYATMPAPTANPGS